MPITTILDEKPVSDFVPVIESSTYRSYKAFKDLKVPDDEIPHKIIAQYIREIQFLGAAHKDVMPTRTITRMIRFKDKGKEYLRFTENWTAKDWKGADIDPVTDTLEGVLYLPNEQPVTDERGARIGTRITGAKTSYEIPFSKANVDKWIEQTGSDKDSIIYTVRTDKRRDNCQSYDQFVNTTWIQANDIMMQDGGFEMAYVESLRPADKKKTS
jgi:hypothetical protein